jgi:N-methylhydantoinase B
MGEGANLSAIDLQILWNRLISVVEEQAQTLIRTAFSTSVREAGDLSAGVFDLKGQMLAQAVTGTPGHVNAMAASVNFFLEKYPIRTMEEGDVYLTNDPWMGTGHLHDFTMVTPTFHNGRPVALFAATVHVVDIGGIGFGPDGRQVFEEGLNIPIMPFAKRGQLNHSLIQIVKANVREPRQVEGDLHSLASSNEVGGRRLLAMLDEFDLAGLDGLAETIIENSRNAMLAEIRALPEGRHSYTMRIDGYDKPVDLVATLTISEDGIDIDFNGTSPVSSYGVNVPLTYTQAYASFGVRCVVGAAVPNNAGSLAPIRVTAPEGSILNAPPPCAVSARHVIGQMLPDVVLGCLYEATGGQVPAEGSSSLWNPMLIGGHGLVGDADYGNARPFAVNLFHSGGSGARPAKDGLSATAFPSGVRNTPVEINETLAPVVIWRKEYTTDSGGPGRFRGGTGQVMEITHVDKAPFAVGAMFDRVIHPARGRSGGANGGKGAFYLKNGQKLRGKGRQTVPPGETVVMAMPGGGGYGDPFERDPERVAADVLNGLVSLEAARRDYGVACSATGEVNAQETARLRGA